MKARQIIFWIFSCSIPLVLSIALILFLFIPSNTRDNQNPARQTEMVELTLRWGRFAPFPKETRHFSVKTEGGAFSRSFRVSFEAPKKTIEQWIADSPGLTDVKVENIPEGRKYVITPGGGAGYAEAVISHDSNKVSIYVSWS